MIVERSKLVFIGFHYLNKSVSLLSVFTIIYLSSCKKSFVQNASVAFIALNKILEFIRWYCVCKIYEEHKILS